MHEKLESEILCMLLLLSGLLSKLDRHDFFKANAVHDYIHTFLKYFGRENSNSSVFKVMLNQIKMTEKQYSFNLFI